MAAMSCLTPSARVIILDVDALAFIFVVRNLEGIGTLVIGVVLIVLEHIIVIVFRLIEIGSSRELGGGWVGREVCVEGASTVGSSTSIGTASSSRGGCTRRGTRGTTLAASTGLGPCVEVLPFLEPGNDSADQSKVATQHPQVEAIGKEDEESLQRCGEREECQEDEEENLLEAEKDHQETEYP